MSHPHLQLEQRFYRVVGLSPFWFVDVCVQQHGRETVFAPRDPFKVVFDRSGVVQTTAVTDEAFVAEAVRTLERAGRGLHALDKVSLSGVVRVTPEAREVV